MSTSARSDRPRGLLARLAAVTLVAAAVGSCTSVLSLDEYQDGAAELCSLLSGCYALTGIGECEVWVGDNLGADPDTAVTWLEAITTRACLDTCSAARACLDSAPVCAADLGAGCGQREACCGFTTGDRDCRGDRCCVTQGQLCTDDVECCDQACDRETRRCGGTVCRPADADCLINAECCSGSCRDFKCSRLICSADGFDCATDAECCSRFCGDAGRCAEPVCGAEGAVCAGDGDCCTGLQCHMLGTRGFCSPGGCTPHEVDCQSHAQCCSGYCDPAYHKCSDACREVGTACIASAQCCSGECGSGGVCVATTCSKTRCDTDAECCSKKCVAHTCAPACAETLSRGHSVCIKGEPLDPTWADPSGKCALEICKTDSYCCCNAWDLECVLQAIATDAPADCLAITCN